MLDLLIQNFKTLFHPCRADAATCVLGLPPRTYASQLCLATVGEEAQQCVKWPPSQPSRTNNSDPQSIVSLHKYTDKQMISLPMELGVWAAREEEEEEGTSDLIRRAEASPL